METDVSNRVYIYYIEALTNCCNIQDTAYSRHAILMLTEYLTALCSLRILYMCTYVQDHYLNNDPCLT